MPLDLQVFIFLVLFSLWRSDALLGDFQWLLCFVSLGNLLSLAEKWLELGFILECGLRLGSAWIELL